MAETEKERKARLQRILAVLNAPGGRDRWDTDIAAELGCSPRSVAYVRRKNPTWEEMAAKMKGMDASGLFPGIYEWWLTSSWGRKTHD